MRCRSCNVLNMHALGKRVTQISMNARAVAGVNEVNCLGMLGCGMWGQLLIGDSNDRSDATTIHALSICNSYNIGHFRGNCPI